MGSSLDDKSASMSNNRPYGADLLRRAKRPGQQTDRVEILQLLAVFDIALKIVASAVTRVDQQNIKPMGFQDLVQWNPVDPGGFHRDGFDSALFEPGDHFDQVSCIGPKDADRLCTAVGRH